VLFSGVAGPGDLCDFAIEEIAGNSGLCLFDLSQAEFQAFGSKPSDPFSCTYSCIFQSSHDWDHFSLVYNSFIQNRESSVTLLSVN
jgi:hypothetical protein